MTDTPDPIETLWLLQVDFPTEGPFGDDMAHDYAELARSIAQVPGLIWKLWTENSDTREAGGVYAFTTRANAQAYLDMHTARLNEWGVTGIRGKIFEVNRPLSQITRGLPWTDRSFQSASTVMNRCLKT